MDPVVRQIVNQLRREKAGRVRAKERKPHIGLTMHGQARVRLLDADVCREVKNDCPGMEFVKQRDIMLREGMQEDSGWSGNTVVDASRLMLASDIIFYNGLNLFIHESTAPGNVRRSSIQFLYPDQTGQAQIRPDDLFDEDEATLFQEWTTQFQSPGSLDRDINMVGLTAATAISGTENAIHQIRAYTVLSSTVQQTTLQVADVVYRVTWSLD